MISVALESGEGRITGTRRKLGSEAENFGNRLGANRHEEVYNLAQPDQPGPTTVVKRQDSSDVGSSSERYNLVVARYGWLYAFLFSFTVEYAERHSSVSSVAALRTGGCWFDPGLGQYSLRGLMIVIATEFIPLSPLSVVSTIVVWESSQWLGNNIVRSTGERNSRKAWIGALVAAM